MRVSLVAMTQVLPSALPLAGWVQSAEQKAYAVNDTDLLAEFAGRLCYQSWARTNPATVTNEGYLFNIINQRHFSVMEHASFSFYVDGVSRSLLAELTRHRHLSFSVLSQRYVDESYGREIYPPALPVPTTVTDTSHKLLEIAYAARNAYSQIVDELVAKGLTRKEARQAARSVLPNATETKFIVTGNVRAWRDVISKRNHPAADAEIRALGRDILRMLKLAAPNSFQDMEVECDDCPPT